MIKYRPANIPILLLITAFLTVQWSSVHIHLADQHDHDGSHHQHNAQAHAHHPVNHHGDVIDSSYEAEQHEVVELEHDCTSPKAKKSDNHTDVLIFVACQSFLSPQFTSARLPEQEMSQQSYPTYSTIRPRAPPLLV